MSSEPSEESFAALFEQQPSREKRPRAVRVGARIEATVVQIGRDTVFLELDGKRQAYIDAADVRAPDGSLPLQLGDKMVAQVIDVDARTGNVRLGRTLGRPNSLAAIEQACEAGVPVEGKVTAINKGGVEVDLAGARAFCPISQLDSKYVQDPGSFVGKMLRFLVTDIRDGGKSTILSRRAVLERDAREASEQLLRTLAPGVTVRASVTSVREFGAFVELGGGIEGLIPASEITHDRSVSVQDAVKPGEVVEVQVRELKHGSPQRSGGEPSVRIILSLKALAQDPWATIDASLAEGKVVMGTVTRSVEFGVFVRVGAGLEGLLHVSELGGKKDPHAFKAGQSIAVVINKIDQEARKMSLVPAPEGVGAGAVVQPVQLTVGAIVRATVERIETYGVFAQVEGSTGRAGRGLIPNAELGLPRGTDVRKALPEGSIVTAKVLETGKGRLRMSIRAAREDEERAEFDVYRESSASHFGTLGDLLKNKRVVR